MVFGRVICKPFESCALCCDVERAAFAGLNQGGRDDELARLVLCTRHGDDNLCAKVGTEGGLKEHESQRTGKCAPQSLWGQIASPMSRGPGSFVASQ